ncbi:hypothetical protein [Rhodococcus kronopolitis]|uniref:Integral membrane protein n=1 Tax=Rhodococcus kronopolitis TaxID=1460226 RepID=A0ABV9FVZ7_9NOCA
MTTPSPQDPQDQQQQPTSQDSAQQQDPQLQYPAQPQYPQPQYPAQQPYPQAPPVPPKPQPPVDVVTAFQLLCGVAGLAVVNLIATLAVAIGDRASFADQLVRDIRAQDEAVEITRSTAEGLLLIGFGLTAVLGLVLIGVYLLFAFKMRAGRNWARMVVTMIAVMMVFVAIPTVFGLGAAGGAAAVVAGGAGILQAVLAVGAVILMHRADSNRYFLPGLQAK